MLTLHPVKDLFFPPRCAICDDLLPYGKCGLCAHCSSNVRTLEEPQCMKCGKEIYDDTAEYCSDCARKKRSYVRGFPLFNYVPPVSDAMSALKFGGRKEYGEIYGIELGKHFVAKFRDLNIDVLVPVPVHPKKLKKRGYNQAECIADGLSLVTKIPVMTDLLLRVENTRAQKELSDDERERNLRTAFAGQRKIHPPKCVMLVDDIYTTGSTIESCTRALLAVGVERVYYTSVCVGKTIG